MNVLVINLTRFGDLLQTQPVLSSFSQRGDSTALVCLENFSGAAVLLRDIDDVLPMPGADFLSSVERDWKSGLGAFENFCREVERRFSPDVVVNLTPSVSARLLAMRLGKDCEIRGFALDEFGFNADTSGWAAFLQVASANRGASPFNVVDLFRKVAGLDDSVEFRLADVPSEKVDDALQMLRSDSGEKSASFAGFQPGASEERRRWPAEYFSRLGRMLWNEKGVVPVLLGTASEGEVGQEVAQGWDFPFVNLMGRTGLGELSAVLANLAFLVTNDTGTMHLAAGLGVPVASVFLATAQPWDTGPVRSGALSLEPDIPCHPCAFGTACDIDNACRRQITPEVVYEYLRSFIDSGKWIESKGSSAKTAGARAWLARQDESGFMDLDSLSGHDESDRAIWIRIQREAYRRFLDGEDLSGFCDIPIHPSDEFCIAVGGVLDEASAMLFLLIRQTGLLAASPTEAVKTKFLANIQKMHDKISATPVLSVLGALWLFQSQQHSSLDGLAALLERYAGLVSFLRRSLS